VASNRRWLKLFLISFAIAIVAIIVIVRVAFSGDPRSEGQEESVDNFVHAILAPALLLGLIGLVILIIKYAVKTGIEEARDSSIPEAKTISMPKPGGFPVVTRIPEYAPPTDGHGRYRIEGVDRQTKMDTTLHVQADSAANAKVKAELEGVIVTSVAKA